jgi:hypothetical protein
MKNHMKNMKKIQQQSEKKKYDDNKPLKNKKQGNG